MQDCDQQGEARLKKWNLPVTGAQCAGCCVKLQVVCSWVSGEPPSPLQHRSFSNSFLSRRRLTCSQSPGTESAPEVDLSQTSPLRQGETRHPPGSVTQRFYSLRMQEVNSGCARPLPWRSHPSKSAWILRWKPPERKDGRTSSHRTSGWAAETGGKAQTGHDEEEAFWQAWRFFPSWWLITHLTGEIYILPKPQKSFKMKNFTFFVAIVHAQLFGYVTFARSRGCCCFSLEEIFVLSQKIEC